MQMPFTPILVVIEEVGLFMAWYSLWALCDMLSVKEHVGVLVPVLLFSTVAIGGARTALYYERLNRF